MIGETGFGLSGGQKQRLQELKREKILSLLSL